MSFTIVSKNHKMGLHRFPPNFIKFDKNSSEVSHSSTSRKNRSGAAGI